MIYGLPGYVHNERQKVQVSFPCVSLMIKGIKEYPQEIPYAGIIHGFYFIHRVVLLDVFQEFPCMGVFDLPGYL